jgi:hypothetical protein
LRCLKIPSLSGRRCQICRVWVPAVDVVRSFGAAEVIGTRCEGESAEEGSMDGVEENCEGEGGDADVLEGEGGEEVIASPGTVF